MDETRKSYDTPKMIRVNGEDFDAANEIFKSAGFTFSDVVRMIISQTVRDGRIPRCIGSRDAEEKMDQSKERDRYLENILGLAGFKGNGERKTKEDYNNDLLRLFSDPESSAEMKNRDLREWAAKTGLPDTLSVNTIAELYDNEVFAKNPWYDDLCVEIEPETFSGSGITDSALKAAMIVMDNLETMKRNLRNSFVRIEQNAVKYLLESDNSKKEETRR